MTSWVPITKERVINVVALGPKGYLDARGQLDESGTHKRLGFEKAWWRGIHFYHRDGRRYEVASASLVGSLAPLRLLPSWIYNPWVRISYTYRDVGSYTIEQLVSGVEAAIDQDDDVITQFREASALRARLAGAKTFDAVAAVLTYARVGL